jgi:hypothetical protein
MKHEIIMYSSLVLCAFAFAFIAYDLLFNKDEF